MLAKRGVAATGVVRAVRPEHRPIYDALCKLGGKAAVDDVLATQNISDSPWLYLVQIGAKLALGAKLAPIADDDVLAYYLAGRGKQHKTPVLDAEAREWDDDGTSI